jgi:hypothetical protein
LNIRVANPSSVSRGVSQLRVDGKTLAGNVVPVSALRDDLTIEVTLGG